MILESKQALFLLQNPKSTIPGSVYQTEELASRGGLGKQSTLWELGSNWPQTVLQAWPLFSFLRNGVKDKRRAMLVFPEGLETDQEAPGPFSNIETPSGVLHLYPWCWAAHAEGGTR